MTVSFGNKELVVMTIIFLLLSILCRFITGIFMNLLLREAENMATTNNRFLQQCKVRFRNSYKLNDGVPNIPVFVDRVLGKIRIGKFTVSGLSHMAAQLMLLSVVTAGLTVCLQIASGKTLLETLPHYLLCFLGLYVYFSVSGMVDMDGKYQRLKVELTDYLENHMAPRLAVLDEAKVSDMEENEKSVRKNHQSITEAGNAEELEELLKEFFA